MICARLISLLIGYVCGLILWGYLTGRLHHIDIRTKGSGNVGTTNTLRVMGLRAGVLTLIVDCMKAVLAAILVSLIFSHFSWISGTDLRILRLYAAFGAVLGHMYPCYFRFKGGKGIATGLGFLIVVEPRMLIVAGGVFILLVAISRFISFGSIIAALSLPIQALIFYAMGWFHYGSRGNIEAAVLTSIVGIMAIIKHRSNIGRLIKGNENKFTFHPKTGI
ncbi:MAG: glycerol-3-phosphate 1-O-acyltransferase PlsY [Lachnospiraceae bacterium]|nr:glycerol-3-phosphate 1-O-acyltransferase PlsY [Lachnospiraceae bacterium]